MEYGVREQEYIFRVMEYGVREQEYGFRIMESEFRGSKHAKNLFFIVFRVMEYIFLVMEFLFRERGERPFAAGFRFRVAEEAFGRFEQNAPSFFENTVKSISHRGFLGAEGASAGGREIACATLALRVVRNDGSVGGDAFKEKSSEKVPVRRNHFIAEFHAPDEGRNPGEAGEPLEPDMFADIKGGATRA